jgi:hypothetical protein
VYSSGGVCTGASTTFEATIHDDDNYQLNSIHQLRNLYTGSGHTFPGEYFIEGTVTSVDNITPGKIFIEDASGGIRVSVNSGKSFAKGNIVLLNLKQSIIDQKQGVFEVAQVTNATLIGPGEIFPTLVTLEELVDANAEFQSRYVTVRNVHFAEANGTTLMYGDHLATNGAHTIIVRTTGFASFREETLPAGNLAVSGIVTEENGILVLHPQVFSEDVISDATSIRPWNPEFPVREPIKRTRK